MDECIVFVGLCLFDFGKLVEIDRSVGGLGLWWRVGNFMYVLLVEKFLFGEKFMYLFFFV